jgi:flagellar hook-associated protein 1 FlgK
MDLRDGTTMETKGIPYYLEKLNNLARAFVQEVNAVHSQGYTDPPTGTSVSGVNFFCDRVARYVRDTLGSGNRYFLNDNDDWECEDTGVIHSGPGVPLGFDEGFDISRITAANFRLDQRIIESVFNIAASDAFIDRQGTDLELQRGNNRNMNALYDLFLHRNITVNIYEEDGVTLRHAVHIGGLDSYATQIRFDIAAELSFTRSLTDTTNVLLLSAEENRESVSGVSLDEEMTNIIRFQHAYSGAARVITAMDEMLDVLINRTGRVGL